MTTRGETLRVGGMEIQAVDLARISEADVAAWLAYDAVLTRESPPTPVEPSRSRLWSLPPSVSVRVFVARDPDGAIVGEGRAMFNRTEGNRHVCQAQVSVRPDRRRRGVATALLGMVAEAAAARECTLLMGWSSGRVPAGDDFARGMGAAAGQIMHEYTLRLAEVDRAAVRRGIDEGAVRAEGYRLAFVESPFPAEMIEAIVDLRRVMNAAPRDDLLLEAPVITAQELRGMEERARQAGIELWSLFARHDPTGELAGFTEVGYHEGRPKVVLQWSTAVRPSHRGHALGKWLKAAMVERVLRERPEAEEIRTAVADSNAAMLAVNRELGFRPVAAMTAWQVELRHLRRRPAGDPGSADPSADPPSDGSPPAPS